MKHVFITGASGFIGGYAADKFAAEGWHVLALCHRSTSAGIMKLVQSGAATIINGDVTDSKKLKSSVVSALEKRGAKLDAIINCAGRASDIGWRSEFRRTNLESVQVMVGLVKDLNVGRLVFVSTTDVYGLRDYEGAAAEDLPLRARPRNPYPEFKIQAEEHIRANLASESYSIVRPAQVWGVGDRTLTPRIVEFLRGSPWIIHFGRWCGRNRWPLAHVRNVASVLFLAATEKATDGLAINVVDSEWTTMDDFYRILAEIYLPHKQFKAVTLPFWVGWCAGAIISCISNLLNLERPFADPSLYALYSVSHNLNFSNKRMKKLLSDAGIPIVTRKAGIAELRIAEKEQLD